MIRALALPALLCACSSDVDPGVDLGSATGTDDGTPASSSDTAPADASTSGVPAGSTGTTTGCQSDDACADDPAGPHCDPATGTCGGECVPAQTRPCYTGPGGTEGVGACTAGVQRCGADGLWDLWCDGEVVPTGDDCNADGKDDDCDGLVDDTDRDGDGYGACSSDCCDVDGGGCNGAALVNPGAFEVDDNGVDDDCDLAIDEVDPTCDGGLASASSDADDYARALDLCQFTTEAPEDPKARVWGVVDAAFSLTDGNGAPLSVQRSLRGDFGNLIDPEQGDRMAVLSSGHAADATDVNPGFAAFETGVNLGTNSPAPADWLAANGGTFPNPAGCVAPWDEDAHDPIMLTLRVRVPTNARSFSMKMFFLSAEYPEWVCSAFNDFFVALIDSSGDNPEDKNIAIYDDSGTRWPVGVNLVMVADGLFTQCQNGEVGCAGDAPGDYAGCVGNALLAGTGFDASDGACDAGQNQVGGGTGWLRMSGNVTGGELMELRLAVWDTSGHIYDSLVLLDDWEWSLEAATPGVAPG